MGPGLPGRGAGQVQARQLHGDHGRGTRPGALGDSRVRAARAMSAVLQERVLDKGAAAWEKRFLGIGVSQLLECTLHSEIPSCVS